MARTGSRSTVSTPHKGLGALYFDSQCGIDDKLDIECVHRAVPVQVAVVAGVNAQGFVDDELHVERVNVSIAVDVTIDDNPDGVEHFVGDNGIIYVEDNRRLVRDDCPEG